MTTNDTAAKNDEDRFLSMAEVLIKAYEKQLMIDGAMAWEGVQIPWKRYKNLVDDYIKMGTGKVAGFKDVAVRIVRNERQYYDVRARQHFENFRADLEFFMVDFPAIPNKTIIREKLMKRLIEIETRSCNLVDDSMLKMLKTVMEYRTKEIAAITAQYRDHRKVAKKFFAIDAGLTRASDYVDHYERDDAIEKKTLTVEEYEESVTKAADSYKRLIKKSMAIFGTLSEQMETFAKDAINENLTNGSAVFDVFTNISKAALTKVTSDVLKSMETVEENLRNRVKYSHSICKSKIASQDLFQDLVYADYCELSRESAEKKQSIEASLAIYRKEERLQAAAEYEDFKTSTGIRAMQIKFKQAEMIDLNDYEMKEIGRGAQAAVYSIMMEINGEFGKYVAKKYTQGSTAEITLCGVKHRNIASYLNVGKRDGDIYLISDFHPKTLDGEIEKSPYGLPKSIFIKWLYEMAEGMRHVRLQNMYHGDIKPSNVLISEDDSAKLADFGISLTREQVHLHRRECDWSGTREYMAPELIRAEESINDKCLEFCDVWSYGIVAWQMMSRRHPYEGIERQRLIAIVGKDAKHPSLPNASNLESLVNLLRKCWNKNNPDRPPFHQILKDLENVREELDDMDEEEWKEECALWNSL